MLNALLMPILIASVVFYMMQLRQQMLLVLLVFQEGSVITGGIRTVRWQNAGSDFGIICGIHVIAQERALSMNPINMLNLFLERSVDMLLITG